MFGTRVYFPQKKKKNTKNKKQKNKKTKKQQQLVSHAGQQSPLKP